MHIQKISEAAERNSTNSTPRSWFEEKGNVQRHWEEIISLTIHLKVLDLSLDTSKRKGPKEYNIEQLLKEMLAQWEGINF